MAKKTLCVAIILMTLIVPILAENSRQFYVNLDMGEIKTSEIAIRIPHRKPIFIISHNRDESVSFRIAFVSIVEFVDNNGNNLYDYGESVSIINLQKFLWEINYSIIKTVETSILVLDMRPEKLPGPQEHWRRPAPLMLRLIISSNRTRLGGVVLNSSANLLINLTFYEWRWQTPNSKLAMIVNYGAVRGKIRRHYVGQKNKYKCVELLSEGATTMYINFDKEAEFDGKTTDIIVDAEAENAKLILPRYEETGKVKIVLGLNLSEFGVTFSPNEIHAISLFMVVMGIITFLGVYSSKRKVKLIKEVLSEAL